MYQRVSASNCRLDAGWRTRTVAGRHLRGLENTRVDRARVRPNYYEHRVKHCARLGGC